MGIGSVRIGSVCLSALVFASQTASVAVCWPSCCACACNCIWIWMPRVQIRAPSLWDLWISVGHIASRLAVSGSAPTRLIAQLCNANCCYVCCVVSCLLWLPHFFLRRVLIGFLCEMMARVAFGGIFLTFKNVLLNFLIFSFRVYRNVKYFKGSLQN